MVKISRPDLNFTTADIWLRGYVWIIMQVILIVVLAHQTYCWFPHYHKKKSPLQFTYPFLIASCIAFIVNGAGNVHRGSIPFAYELGLAFIVTAYCFVLFTWVLIVLKVFFMSARARSFTIGFLIGANLLFYATLLAVSAINYDSGTVVVAVVDLLLIATYLITSQIVKHKLSKPQLAQIKIITRMADILCVMGAACIIVLIIFAILSAKAKSHTLQTVFYFISRVGIFFLAGWLIYHLRGFAKTNIAKGQLKAAPEDTTISRRSTVFSSTSIKSSSDEVKSSSDDAFQTSSISVMRDSYDSPRFSDDTLIRVDTTQVMMQSLHSDTPSEEEASPPPPPIQLHGGEPSSSPPV